MTELNDKVNTNKKFNSWHYFKCKKEGEIMDFKELTQDMFTYHPWNEEKISKGTLVRYALQKAYLEILETVPDCPDRDAALRKIREARMDCNSAITHDGKY